MAKIKYKYNPNTLNYEKIQLTLLDKLKKGLTYILVGLFFATIIIALAYTFIDSPKELSLKRELAQLKSQYELLNKNLDQAEALMADMEVRDDNIYRQILESEPIPQSVRAAGVGGVNRYKHLEGYTNSELVINTQKRIDKLKKRLYVQSKSFDEVVEFALSKEKMLASIPAIQPVPNKNLKRASSGFGYRMHPIYKVRKMHWGMDFSAPTGTEIFATGDGKIAKVEKSRRGYGWHIIIEHGYGYETLYAHMSRIDVRRGQKVSRGDVIGLVGNTGTSTAPHLHYEVIKDGKKINPANFYFNDLTPEEYDLMIELSATVNQSFD
ncbi:MAG: peptidoglycan DD-metalloendopeptidase family protein [Flavobacteriales bacterium]|nr:peptidoglycan DD-metalloendopeptidase family protein [Flavobacteriales bacterium]